MSASFSHEETEARITALLLGELSKEDAAAVRAAMANDPALRQLYTELARTIGLVREASANPGENQDIAAAPLKLSARRRERLLATFNTVAPPEFKQPPQREVHWLIPMSAAAAVIAFIGAAALLPGLGMSSRREMAALERRDSQNENLAKGKGMQKKERSGVPFAANSPESRPSATTKGLGLIPKKALADKETGVIKADSNDSPHRETKGVSAPPPGQVVNGLANLGSVILPSMPDTAAPKERAGAGVARVQIDSSARSRSGGFGGGGGAQIDAKSTSLSTFGDAAASIQGVPARGEESTVAARAVEYQNKVPNLGDLPLLGKLFREESIPAPAPGQTAAPNATTVPPASAEIARKPLLLAQEQGRGAAERLKETDLNRPSSGTENFGRFAYIVRPNGPSGQVQDQLDRNQSGNEWNLSFPPANGPAPSETAANSLFLFDSTPPNEPPAVALQTNPNPDDASGLSSSSSHFGNTLETFRESIPVREAAKPEASAAKERVLVDADGTAHVKTAEPDHEVPPLLFGMQGSQAFDPYFVQTEFEKVKSKTVLNEVVERLGLDSAWADQSQKGKLSLNAAYEKLAKRVDVRQSGNSDEIEIQVRDGNATESAQIAQTIADVYRDLRAKDRGAILAQEAKAKDEKPAGVEPKLDLALPKPATNAPVPQPEIQTKDNAFSTFSLNVSDVSFKLAAASLEKGVMPDPNTVRSEEFINAFDYHDPEPAGAPIAFAWERARYPFAQDREVLRLSIKTAAQGRQQGYPLNLVLLLDKSGSMERADRVQTVREALRVLTAQLEPQDRLSVITFARTPRLWADGVPSAKAGDVLQQAADQTPEGGTNLEDALNLAYQTALKNFIQGGGNRVVLLTDGAANLGDVNPEVLRRKVEANRLHGVALDCFGVGWDGFDDRVLETLSSHGDGRYGFLNTPEEVKTGFADQLAGALKVAAADVKVQVEFNPKRVLAYRQIGYAKHQLTQEQFRDNKVDAAELGAAESGNALYIMQTRPQPGETLGWVRVRYKVPATGEYREQEWTMAEPGAARELAQSSGSLQLASTAAAFAEWLVSSPYAGEVTPDRLLNQVQNLTNLPGAGARTRQLAWMIRQAKSLAGK